MQPFLTEPIFDFTGSFTNPFRYFPHPLIASAAEEIMRKIDSIEDLRGAFSEGKMIGVLLVEDGGSIGYLAAFSGSVGGRSLLTGFVPPIFDLLAPSGHFKIHEAEITKVNKEIESLESSPELLSLRKELIAMEKKRDDEIRLMIARMAISKRERDEIRSEVSDSARLAELIRESQFEKAELRRLKASWNEKISLSKDRISSIENRIGSLKQKRSEMSDELQEWIFRQYIVHNSLGEESSVYDIFREAGLTPPGGTGDCAAPKLLEYAFRNGLKPLAMGEFWYGKSPETAVRTHGHFYPSCTSKCGPLLGWMLRGMNISANPGTAPAGDGASCSCNGREGHEVGIIYEDEALIAVDKPSGMPSVPGLDGRISVYEILKESFGELFAVHRLDMDTSGILLFAKTQEAAVSIQKQFENQTIEKTYIARLSAPYHESGTNSETSSSGRFGKVLKTGDKGSIELPLSPDYDERPRQKVDFAQGKTALTEYEVKSLNKDGSIDILFRPRTGRTHQLRVHAAHHLGLARPILGDPLYGGSPAPRLHLHAASISFLHPTNGKTITLNTTSSPYTIPR